MRLPLLTVVASASFICAACAIGQARNVLVEKDGGVVAMPYTNNSYEEKTNRSRALSLIAAKCGKKYEITREEEVAVGDVEDSVVKNEWSKNTDRTVVKSKKYEYRISYKCQ